MQVTEITTNAFWKGEMDVKGIITDQGKQFRASLFFKGSQINDYSCSCAKGHSYKGMCRHCEELLAEYKRQAANLSGKPVSTSQSVRTMIREYTNREVARLINAGEGEKVQLVPRLKQCNQEIRMEFKLGCGRLYVLKDLAAFALAMANNSMVEYGKGLAFHHNLDAFTASCRPLVEFVLELVNLYLEHYKQFQRSSFQMQSTLRELNLSRINRDRLFAIMMGKTLEIEDYQANVKVFHVEAGNPPLQIEVKKEGQNGIKVILPKALTCISGEHFLYLGVQDHLFQCDEVCSNTLRVFMEQMVQTNAADYQAVVNEKDIPLFYERVLKKIEAFAEIIADGVDLESYRPDELKARFEFDSQESSQLTMLPTLSYGSYSFHPMEDDKVPRTICRDVPGEFFISQLITRYFKFRESESECLVIQNDEDTMYRLLLEGISEFMEAGEVYISDSVKQLKVLPPPRIAVGVSTSGRWLELSVDVEGMTNAQLAQILKEYSLKKKYYRLKSGEFLQLGDGGLMTLGRMAEGMGISQNQLQSGQIRLPAYRALYLDSIFKEDQGMTFYRDNLFKAVVRGMKAVEDSDFEIPPALVQVLRGYQKTGFRWLKTLDSYGFGGILADDMGLGKTLQVISVVLSETGKQDKGCSLIVCPASLVYNWENEFHTFAPSVNVCTVLGTAAEREEMIIGTAGYDVLITSYDLLKRDIILYDKIKFRYQIIDEAQYIKNADTQSARAVKAIESQVKFALTGTPIENRLSELWSIFDYLMPGFLFSYQKFKKEYEIPIVKEQDSWALQSLRRMIGPFILRRLKRDVLKELPDKLETVIYSKFEKEQKEIYAANARRLKDQLEQQSGSEYNSDRFQILAELTKLRQICCDPSLCYDHYQGGSAKLDTCIDLVSNGVESGHKILLFSQFTSMLDIIGKRLTQEGITFFMLTGSNTKEERQRMVNAFPKENIPVFLISLKAGGTGLNLTAADIVIHYDPWWNVAAQNQATDRAHRIGQDKQVSVFKLITKGTIEENILKLQEAKKNLAEQVITEGTVSFASLTKEDLLEILS